MDDVKIRTKGWRFGSEILRAPLPAMELVGCGVLLAAFGKYYLQAHALPAPFNQMDPGPGGFPLLLAVAGLVGVVVVALAAVVRALDPVPVDWVAVHRPLSVAFAAVLMVVQSIWFEQLGTIASVLLFGFGTMLACGERRIVHLIGVPVALAAFIYGVFVFALQVHLP